MTTQHTLAVTSHTTHQRNSVITTIFLTNVMAKYMLRQISNAMLALCRKPAEMAGSIHQPNFAMAGIRLLCSVAEILTVLLSFARIAMFTLNATGTTIMLRHISVAIIRNIL
jgi:hypothetical protein